MPRRSGLCALKGGEFGLQCLGNLIYEITHFNLVLDRIYQIGCHISIILPLLLIPFLALAIDPLKVEVSVPWRLDPHASDIQSLCLEKINYLWFGCRSYWPFTSVLYALASLIDSDPSSRAPPTGSGQPPVPPTRHMWLLHVPSKHKCPRHRLS